MKLRLYKFSLEVLDEPLGGDEDFEAEILEHLQAYLEAFHVQLTLIEANECMTFEGDLEMAEA